MSGPLGFNGRFSSLVSALRLLLDSLDPRQDQLAHRWLTERIAATPEVLKNISLGHWLQNAPDR